MRYATILTAAAVAALASGCSNTSDGDQVACETVAVAQNRMMSAIYSSEGQAMLDAQDSLPRAYDDALIVAEDPTLTIELNRARDLILPGLIEDESEDAGVAYFT